MSWDLYHEGLQQRRTSDLTGAPIALGSSLGRGGLREPPALAAHSQWCKRNHSDGHEPEHFTKALGFSPHCPPLCRLARCPKVESCTAKRVVEVG